MTERIENDPHFIGAAMILLIIVLFIGAVTILDYFSQPFEYQCDELYGKGNWSEYGADWIDFMPGSNHPIYFKDGHSFTCFKTGTTP